jgi:hypothetical protein
MTFPLGPGDELSSPRVRVVDLGLPISAVWWLFLPRSPSTVRNSDSLFTFSDPRIILSDSNRNSYRPARHIRKSIRERTIPSQQVLVPNLDRCCALDRLYLGHVLSPRAQPGQRRRSTMHP